jgi:O-antigen/teichoic acid export membrane protein
VSMFLMTLFIRLGVIVIKFMGDNASVAIFGTAFSMVASAGFVAMSVTIAYFPRLVRNLQNSNRHGAAAIIRQKVNMVTLVYGTLCTLGIVLAPPVVSLLFGKKFAASGWLMVPMMPVLYISCINVPLKYALNAMEYNWADTLSVALGIGMLFMVFWQIKIGTLPQIGVMAWGMGEFTIFVSKIITLKYFASMNISILLIIITTIGLLLINIILRINSLNLRKFFKTHC